MPKREQFRCFMDSRSYTPGPGTGVPRARWANPHRGWAVLAGVVLISVPTFFTVVPGWARWSGWWRATVLVLWVVVALLVLYSR